MLGWEVVNLSLRRTAGQQPKRQKVVASAPDLPRAQQLMARYLDGDLAAPPWDAMGVSKAPVIGGIDRRPELAIYRVVRDMI